ncbi:MAG: hypothetical protein ACREYF_24345 [Gammaproteobacteria bacterium]
MQIAAAHRQQEYLGPAKWEQSFEHFSAITEKRLELIRHVANQEGLNIRQLAQALGRDYKNVYEDVRELCEYGLLEKDDRGTLRAPYDQLVIRADLHQAQVA